MCGVVGIVSKKEFSSHELLSILKNLEYRGYDSAGIAMQGNSFYIEKSVGSISELGKKIKPVKSRIGIAHTRWATHGIVNEENTHPHADCSGKIFIAHNGIIDNYISIRKHLEEKGHLFKSKTDSETIAHFFEEELKTKNIKESVKEFFRTVKGEFAVVLAIENDKNLYAFKRGSPLVLGVAKDEKIAASDINAFIDRTKDAIFFNENEFAVISDNYEFFRYTENNLVKQEKKINEIDWFPSEKKHEYEHYMIKEIMEEPKAAKRLLNSLETDQAGKMKDLKKMIKSSKRVVFVASGSSYHASLLGVYFLRNAGIETHTIIASEFRNFTLFDENTLVIAVSQSGETMDVIRAMNGIKSHGVKIASLVNVPYSTVQRMSNISVNIMAGQEICVAATKTFINQALALLYIASMFGYKEDLKQIPVLMEQALKNQEEIKKTAKTIKGKNDIYILGRSFSYPIAREIALKLKEVSYIHAEGMMGGELKHGTLALIEQDTPVITLMPMTDEEIISNAKEVEARGANVIAFHEDSEFAGIKINANHKGSFAILAAMAGHLMTYYTAKEKGLPIDKPRNLAKSVTVK